MTWTHANFYIRTVPTACCQYCTTDLVATCIYMYWWCSAVWRRKTNFPTVKVNARAVCGHNERQQCCTSRNSFLESKAKRFGGTLYNYTLPLADSHPYISNTIRAMCPTYTCTHSVQQQSRHLKIFVPAKPTSDRKTLPQ